MFTACCGSLRAQRQSRRDFVTGLDDIVFAFSFSPDGRTLAIARGATDPSQRFGRIELWDTENGKLKLVIKGFDGPVSSVSFSPDGQTIVSGSSEYHLNTIQERVHMREGMVSGVLKWWDANSGELKQQLKLTAKDTFTPYALSGNHLARANYSPDGRELVVTEFFAESFLGGYFTPRTGHFQSHPDVHFTSNLKFLEAGSGAQKQKTRLNSNQPAHPLFSPNGELVAIWAEPAPYLLFKADYVLLWNARTGREEHKLKGFKGEPNAVSFSPDGRQLAVASTKFDLPRRGKTAGPGKSEVTLFDVNSQKVLLKLRDAGIVNSVAFSPDGKFLIMGGLISKQNGTAPGLRLWDIRAGAGADLFTGEEAPSEAVGLVAVSQSAGLIAMQSGPYMVKVLDTATWKVRQRWDAASAGDAVTHPPNRFLVSAKLVLAVSFSADGQSLAAETDQGEIKQWDARTGELRRNLALEQADPLLVVSASDGKRFAEVTEGKLLIGEVGGNKRSVPLPPGRTFTAIAMAPDGQTLVVASGDEIMLLTPRGEVIKSFHSKQSSIKRLAFSDDDQRLAVVSDEGTIEIWNLATKSLAKTMAAHTRISTLRFSPNGEELAAANSDNAITLWDLKSGLMKGNLQKHTAPLHALAFSPDGQLLASGGDDRTVIIWELASGKAKRALKGHDQTVTSLAFSPDGQMLASGSGNASVVLWDVRTGKLDRVLQ
jgi:WD40 repeat protein